MRLVVFEDDTFSRFYPLTYMRAVFELRCGMLSAAERLAQSVKPEETAWFARDVLADVLSNRLEGKVNDASSLKGDLLLVNGRVLDRKVADLKPGEVIVSGGTVLAARLGEEDLEDKRSSLEDLLAAVESLRKADVEPAFASYPWDLVNNNARLIEEDFHAAGSKGIEGEFHEQAVLFGPVENVYVAPGAEIEPLACIDCREGPVFIDEGAVVNPHTRIEGPSYIGKETMLVGGKIREGCSIGPVCRVGGEVEECIFHGYMNKYHDGFFGHAYVCEWVNLGALTTNSDIKNDYGSVKVYVDGEFVDTGTTKVGAYIGDHTKTSIGTYFNTGTHVGMMALLVGSGGVLPKFIPGFAWFMEGCITKGFGLGALLETARLAMGRRKKELSPETETLIRQVHELTAAERKAAVKKDRRKLLNK